MSFTSSTLPCYLFFNSVFRRQFLRQMWPIQLVFLHFIVCRMFLSSLAPHNPEFLHRHHFRILCLTNNILYADCIYVYVRVHCLCSHQTAYSLLQQLTGYRHQTKSKTKSMHGRHTVLYILHNNLRNGSRIASNDLLQHIISRQSIKCG
jgi:hypothetical protein